ncbi:hypothetical protein PYK79_25500 [Streptomyces sp. ID05-04B]|uniref:hypothetical protein n=1 Tax=unclassified Streptomyces TaxID=2593676 RepID=UPI000D1B1D3C|nr:MULTISPECIES: hypothetical protein [unclassified Streptomyces]AVV41829.1 hypothetical protein C6376_10660 [Streptomyces sp. P3]MDX5565986.1 hypothetical protein [Streptomyces sp. ID05-04B]
MTGMGVEMGAQAARARALAVLRIRSRALALALLPAAAAVILLVGGTAGHLVGAGWEAARWAVSAVAVVVLLSAGVIALVVARARPAVSPTVAVAERAAPDLYRLVRDLADRLDVPAPSAIALTPDCDSWLEDRTHRAHGSPPPRGADEIAGPGGSRGTLHRRTATAPVLVIGSPFLWWMRVGELRAVLAPVVAGTGPSAHPDIAAARRYVRGLDAAVAVCAERAGRSAVLRPFCSGVGWAARLMLRGCQVHVGEMERGVAAAAAERAQAVDYGLRIVAQEQVGLAYAGWDRLLTRVALPAWRMGRWPSRLDAGVVAALTELSRRDRLAEGFASRLGERPACDLLEEPGVVDEAASLLAARLFHGGPAEPGPHWSPVAWDDYPDEVVDRKWRTDAARLHRVLDALGVRRAPDATTAAHAGGPTLARVLDHLTHPATPADGRFPADPLRPSPALPPKDPSPALPLPPTEAPGTSSGTDVGTDAADSAARFAAGPPPAPLPPPDASPRPEAEADGDGDDLPAPNPRSAALAARIGVEVGKEEAATAEAAPVGPPAPGQGPDAALWDDDALPLFPLQPPRSDRELLADHVTAMVCCAAMDTVGATPGLDWLDGPTLMVDGERVADLAPRVLSLVEDGDAVPLRTWLVELGIRPEKPVRLG